MLFDIDDDDGLRITGWVVPDHPSAEPAVIVATDGAARRRVPATRYRRTLKEERLHATGICGFVVDQATCPELRPGEGVALYEEGSNVLIYRRASAGDLVTRHFHLETEPALPLGDLRGLFQMSYGSVEFLGEESVVSILSIAFTPSVFVSGAVLYRRFEPYLKSGGFRRSILLGDPGRALAARLIGVKDLSRQEGARAGWRSLGRAALIESFSNIDLTDAGALTRAFLRLPDEAILTLADPLTRQLAGRDAQDALRDEHVGTALDSLASFDAIGFDDDRSAFLRTVESMLGPGVNLGSEPADPPGLFAVAAALELCSPASDLVQLDQTVVATAREAFAEAGIRSPRSSA